MFFLALFMYHIHINDFPIYSLFFALMFYKGFYGHD